MCTFIILIQTLSIARQRSTELSEAHAQRGAVNACTSGAGCESLLARLACHWPCYRNTWLLRLSFCLVRGNIKVATCLGYEGRSVLTSSEYSRWQNVMLLVAVKACCRRAESLILNVFEEVLGGPQQNWAARVVEKKNHNHSWNRNSDTVRRQAVCQVCWSAVWWKNIGLLNCVFWMIYIIQVRMFGWLWILFEFERNKTDMACFRVQ
jgi:hypothetical protein